jgi:radical SAM superfamily enzyme YgiQ (UPF0313 family)
MRIAFVSANRERLPDPVIPLGLLSVMTATPSTHDKRLLDLCFETDPQGKLGDWLRDMRPDLVALGLRNLQNSDYTNIEDNLRYCETLVAAIREATGAPVVIGGAGFSVMPGEVMARLRADFGLPGEGERTLPALVAALDTDANLATVPGMLWFPDGELVTNPSAPEFLSMDELESPSRVEVDDRYYAASGIEAVQTKRGCPMRCEYCSYPIIEGRLSRRRSPNRVVDDMERILAERPEANHFFIVDSVFNMPPRHAKAVCRELITRGWSTPWTCYANPIGFDAELAGLMAQAGCVGMEIGTDSGVNSVLKRQKKGFTTSDILRMHELCVDAGLKDCHTFVLGIAGDTPETVSETLAFIDKIDPFAAIIMMWMDDLEAIEPERARQRLAFREQIRGQIEDACRVRKHWIAPQLTVNFDLRLFHVLRRMGMKGPLWQHIDQR